MSLSIGGRHLLPIWFERLGPGLPSGGGFGAILSGAQASTAPPAPKLNAALPNAGTTTKNLVPAAASETARSLNKAGNGLAAPDPGTPTRQDVAASGNAAPDHDGATSLAGADTASEQDDEDVTALPGWAYLPQVVAFYAPATTSRAMASTSLASRVPNGWSTRAVVGDGSPQLPSVGQTGTGAAAIANPSTATAAATFGGGGPILSADPAVPQTPVLLSTVRAVQAARTSNAAATPAVTVPQGASVPLGAQPAALASPRTAGSPVAPASTPSPPTSGVPAALAAAAGARSASAIFAPPASTPAPDTLVPASLQAGARAYASAPGAVTASSAGTAATISGTSRQTVSRAVSATDEATPGAVKLLNAAASASDQIGTMIDAGQMTGAASPGFAETTGAEAAAGSRLDPVLDTRSPAWMATLMERVSEARDAGGARALKITLSPDALGAIEVSVRQINGAMHVHLDAANADARTLLANAQPQLQAMADARGLTLGGSSIGGGGVSAGGGDRQSAHQGAPSSDANSPGPTTSDSDDMIPTSAGPRERIA